jgi:hypothetical protein
MRVGEADVKRIAVRHIAACYDVSERTIYGRTWRHVD